MSAKTRLYIIIAAVFVIAAIIALVVWTCTSQGGGGYDSRVRRLRPSVWAGSSSGGAMPPQLTDGAWHNLGSGDRVTTDGSGEACLDFEGCMLIYLFRDGSNLVKSGCSRSSRSGGNVTCAIEGTGVYNNSCATQVVVETDSATITLNGTWLVVTYLPRWQLTLVLVSEGQADVQPVRDVGTRTMASSIQVAGQHFVFTAPDSMLNAIEGTAGLNARQAYSYDEFAAFIQGLQERTGESRLESWMASAQERARLDGVSFPSAETSPPPVMIAFAEEPDVLNPYYAETVAADYLQDLYMARLWSFDEQGNMVPRLLESIDVQEEGRAFLIRLRQTTWSDGVPLTVGDFQFAYEMVVDEANRFPYHYPFHDYVEGIEVVDEYTFVVYMHKEIQDWPYALNMTPLPRHILEPVLESQGTLVRARWNWEPTVSAGPFVLREWKAGSHMLFEANPGWPEQARLAQIVVRFEPDQDALMAAIEAGESDIAVPLDVPPQYWAVSSRLQNVRLSEQTPFWNCSEWEVKQ